MTDRCKICNTPFDSELHRDCGGDCLLCMAEAGDPDCAVSAVPILRRQIQGLERRVEYWRDIVRRELVELIGDYERELAELKAAPTIPEDENEAVRMFLMFYGGNGGITVSEMLENMTASGFYGCWPAWVEEAENEEHLTKAGAQSWLRYLFTLEEK
jgi:hypothetical protein